MSDEAAATPKKKGGKMKKIIFFVILPLILIGGGVGAGVFAAGKFGGHAAGPKLDPNRPKLVLNEGESRPTDLAPGQQPNPEIYKSTYVPMDQPFTSNLRDTD